MLTLLKMFLLFVTSVLAKDVPKLPDHVPAHSTSHRVVYGHSLVLTAVLLFVLICYLVKAFLCSHFHKVKAAPSINRRLDEEFGLLTMPSPQASPQPSPGLRRMERRHLTRLSLGRFRSDLEDLTDCESDVEAHAASSMGHLVSPATMGALDTLVSLSEVRSMQSFEQRRSPVVPCLEATDHSSLVEPQESFTTVEVAAVDWSMDVLVEAAEVAAAAADMTAAVEAVAAEMAAEVAATDAAANAAAAEKMAGKRATERAAVAVAEVVSAERAATMAVEAEVAVATEVVLPEVAVATEVVLPEVAVATEVVLPEVAVAAEAVLPKVAVAAEAVLPKVAVAAEAVLPEEAAVDMAVDEAAAAKAAEMAVAETEVAAMATAPASAASAPEPALGRAGSETAPSKADRLDISQGDKAVTPVARRTRAGKRLAQQASTTPAQRSRPTPQCSTRTPASSGLKRASSAHDEQLHTAFVSADVTRSGDLSKRELYAALAQVGLALKSSEALGVWRNFDRNRDGRLDAPHPRLRLRRTIHPLASHPKAPPSTSNLILLAPRHVPSPAPLPILHPLPFPSPPHPM